MANIKFVSVTRFRETSNLLNFSVSEAGQKCRRAIHGKLHNGITLSRRLILLISCYAKSVAKDNAINHFVSRMFSTLLRLYKPTPPRKFPTILKTEQLHRAVTLFVVIYTPYCETPFSSTHTHTRQYRPARSLNNSLSYLRKRERGSRNFAKITDDVERR